MPARPLAVTERTAAAMLDMASPEFLRLVDSGALPPPMTLAGNIRRWRMADLEAIVNGQAAIPDDDIEV